MKPFAMQGGRIQLRYVPAVATYPEQFCIEAWDWSGDLRIALALSPEDVSKFLAEMHGVVERVDRRKEALRVREVSAVGAARAGL